MAMSSKAQSMKSIKCNVPSGSTSFDSLDDCGDTSCITIENGQKVVKKDMVVIKNEPSSLRSPSLPPMTMPLELSKGSNPNDGNFEFGGQILHGSVSVAQIPLDNNETLEQQKNRMRCGGKCSIL